MTSHQVFILSGGLGSSGERLVRTALAQFPDQEAAVTVIARVRSRNDLDSAFDAASSSGATVVHTLALELRESDMLSFLQSALEVLESSTKVS